MPTCPNGHQSAADDWCEVCGHRMTGAAAPPGAVPPPPTPPPAAPSSGGGYGYPGPPGVPVPPSQAQGFPGQPGPDSSYSPYSPHPQQQPEACPQCRTPRESQAPFCEECRYNFLTHSPTTFVPAHSPSPPPPPPLGGFPQQGAQGLPQPPAPGAPSFPGAPAEPGRERFDYESSRPSQINRPAEPLAPEPPAPAPGSSPYGQGEGFGRSEGFGQGYAGAQQPMAPPAPPAPQQPQHQPQAPQNAGTHSPPTGDWMLSPPSSPGAPPYQGQQSFPQSQSQGQGQGQGHGQGPGQGQGQSFSQAQGQGAAPASPASAPQQGGAGLGTWVAVIATDREYFTAMMGRSGPEAGNLNLPAYAPEQQLPLSGQRVTIGRRRNSTGESPDIDLARTPEDPGVSHQHAALVQQPDGTWSVVDQDSTNGTTINGAEDPIQPFVPVPLTSGDRVHVGAWTTITLHRM
jgi:hypothetical protein